MSATNPTTPVAPAPWLHRAWKVFLKILSYIAYGEFIVFIGQWLILLSSRIAETVMMFAVLWITCDYVVPDFAGKIVSFLAGPGAPDTLSNLSLIALSILPEIILYSAVITTFKYGLAVWKTQGQQRAGNVAWTVLYGLPTLSFLALTLFTISSFVSTHGHLNATITGVPLVIRCLTGWFYSFVNLVRNHINHTQITPTPADSQQVPVQESQPAQTESMPSIDHAIIAERVVALLAKKGQIPGSQPTLRVDYKALAREMIALMPELAQTSIQDEQVARITASASSDRDTRILTAYHTLKVPGRPVSGRELAEAAKPCARTRANQWLAEHDPDYKPQKALAQKASSTAPEGLEVTVQEQFREPTTDKLERVIIIDGQNIMQTTV